MGTVDPTDGAEKLWEVNSGRKCWNAHGVGDGEPQMPKLASHNLRFVNIGVKPSKQGFQKLNLAVRIIWLPQINEGETGYQENN